ncbi:Nif3-like dinuclear metal center hexameric protein [Burkholderiaceae bacterium]|nr:Nif3-like dinuclear metal center hexameric protein [Burkholderiaceae bacterium]
MSTSTSIVTATAIPHTTRPRAVTTQAVVDQLHTWLVPDQFKDYGPNGLQVEGGAQITHVVSGVTASLALIEAAVTCKADAILVHHGLFWRGQTGVVTGWMRQRLSCLLANNVNLLAYHLPLDAHPIYGNNAALARHLGLTPLPIDVGRFGDQRLGWLGTSDHKDLASLAQSVGDSLGRAPVVIGEASQPIRTVAWCTGGAQGFFEAAIAAGADVFITGEISEPQAHYARESGVAYMACGHHATERYGVAALGEALAAQFGVAHTFIDIDNPA